jgi:hypothetical protein
MPGPLDALKHFVFGTPEAQDLNLPMPAGGKRDPRLPKESSVSAGLRMLRDAAATPPPAKGKK